MLHSAHCVLSPGQAGLVILIGAVAFVVAKGGRAERIAAGLLALAWVGSVLAQPLTGQLAPEIPFMATDLFLALGFLWLAVRYASLWIGAAMILEGALFFLHASHLSEETSRSYAYLAAMNGLSYCVLACVVGAALASWRRRARARRPQPPRAAAVSGP